MLVNLDCVKGIAMEGMEFQPCLDFQAPGQFRLPHTVVSKQLLGSAKTNSPRVQSVFSALGRWCRLPAARQLVTDDGDEPLSSERLT